MSIRMPSKLFRCFSLYFSEYNFYVLLLLLHLLCVKVECISEELPRSKDYNEQ